MNEVIICETDVKNKIYKITSADDTLKCNLINDYNNYKNFIKSDNKKNKEYNEFYSIDKQDIEYLQNISENDLSENKKIDHILNKYHKCKNLKIKIIKYDKNTIKVYDCILLKLKVAELCISFNNYSKYLLKHPLSTHKKCR